MQISFSLLLEFDEAIFYSTIKNPLSLNDI